MRNHQTKGAPEAKSPPPLILCPRFLGFSSIHRELPLPFKNAMPFHLPSSHAMLRSTHQAVNRAPSPAGTTPRTRSPTPTCMPIMLAHVKRTSRGPHSHQTAPVTNKPQSNKVTILKKNSSTWLSFSLHTSNFSGHGIPPRKAPVKDIMANMQRIYIVPSQQRDRT
jgi:hypothetical protein